MKYSSTLEKGTSAKSKFSSAFASFSIVTCLLVAILIYIFILGNSANFEGHDPANHPVNSGFRHILGLIYKGGYIVPILIAMVLINISVAIERLLTLKNAAGKTNSELFVSKIRELLSKGRLEEAIETCDEQGGSLGNVTRSGLVAYNKAKSLRGSLSPEQRELLLKKEIEEATSLEMPMLEKNLVITATLASGSTLVALLGTVLGMIKAFAALGAAGGGDQMALSIGISEALINTALGIGNAALATFLYAYFTSRIDTITYAIDETRFSLEQNFAKDNA